MKKEVFGLVASIFLVSFVIASLVLNGTSSYDSTDVNVTQETGLAHLNLSDEGLILYMPFDYNHSSGVVYDYSNNSNDGEMINFASNYTVDGVFGGAYEFDGVDDYLQVLESFSLKTISLMFYSESSISAGSSITLANLDSTSNPIWMSTASYLLQLTVPGNQVIRSNVSTIDSGWHHVVFVVNESNSKIYYDGQDVTGSTTLTVDSVTASDFELGRRNTGNYYFNGSIDEVMIWNRSLNSTEVATIYNNQSDRFYPKGEMLFQNNNLGTNNTVNISIPNCQTLNGSYLQGKINEGSFVNFSSCNITNYPAEGNLTSANLTLRLNSGDNNFYTPLIIGNISLTSLDNQSSTVTITSPTNGSTSTSSSVSISVTTNENSTCNYSTNSGTTNSSLTENSAGITHTATASSLSNGNYVLNVYCEDLQGNQNHTQNVSFTVAVPATSTEEEIGGSTGLGGTYKPSESMFENGYKVNVRANQKVRIPFDNSGQEITIKEISNSENNVVVSFGGNDYKISLNNSGKIDLDNDGFYDVEIYNKNVYGSVVSLEFNLISEEVPSDVQGGVDENVKDGVKDAIENGIKTNWYVYVGVLLVIVLIVLLVLLKRK